MMKRLTHLYFGHYFKLIRYNANGASFHDLRVDQPAYWTAPLFVCSCGQNWYPSGPYVLTGKDTFAPYDLRESTTVV